MLLRMHGLTEQTAAGLKARAHSTRESVCCGGTADSVMKHGPKATSCSDYAVK